MKCQWTELLNLLPVRFRHGVDKHGKDDGQEIRLRINRPPELIRKDSSVWLDELVTEDDIRFCLNTATRYSPWTAETISQGYVTAAGGHRIGICGHCVYDQHKIKNISYISSVCIRIARELTGVSAGIYQLDRSVLIIGPPGSGKTTLLRDLILNISDRTNKTVAVVDERRELFPLHAGCFCFPCGRHTDVLSGCKKSDGINMVLRTMNPSVIAMDEITEDADCYEMINAAWCGVQLIATAHAGSKQDLFSRKVYHTIIESGIFHKLIILRPDKSWNEEDMP